MPPPSHNYSCSLLCIENANEPFRQPTINAHGIHFANIQPARKYDILNYLINTLISLRLLKLVIKIKLKMPANRKLYT